MGRGRKVTPYPGEPWGFDNCAYRDFTAGISYSDAVYRKSLDLAVASGSEPYMAVLPDIVGEGLRSLDLSLRYLGEVGGSLPPWEWYLAVQDGLEPRDIEGVPVAGVFLGGTTMYKRRAGEWCNWAHSNRIRFHWGRCGTIKKLRTAKIIGADSIDSTFPMWTSYRWDQFEKVAIDDVQGALW